MIDGVSGGALVIRNPKFVIKDIKLEEVGTKQQQKDRKYPLFTFVIRKTYNLSLGKILHLFLKSTDLLSSPVDDIDKEALHKLPFWNSQLIYKEFINLESNLLHRQKISRIYAESLNKDVLLANLANQINTSSNLRFPIFVKNREKLILYLKQDNVFVSDIWYDAPIAPKKYLHMTNYRKGTCINSERVTDEILNLPTHKSVSEMDARKIVNRINIWLK